MPCNILPYKLLEKNHPSLSGAFLCVLGLILFKLSGFFSGIIGIVCISLGVVMIFTAGLWYMIKEILDYRGNLEKNHREELNTAHEKNSKELKEERRQFKKQSETHTQKIVELLTEKNFQSDSTSTTKKLTTDISFGVDN